MKYQQIIGKLSYLKAEEEIADYNIESSFAVKDGWIYVQSRLVIFKPDGKPTVATGLIQGKVNEVTIDSLQEQSVEIAYLQNPLIGSPEQDNPII